MLGVSLFIKECLDYHVRKDLNVANDCTEAIFIELETHIPQSNNVVIGTVYRPPNSDILSFLTNMKKILSALEREKKYVYIMGDFNINLLYIDKHLQTSEFLEMMYSYFSYFPLINKPTRVNKETATLIDNILCNVFKSNIVSDSGILFTDVSDHLPIFCVSCIQDIDSKLGHQKRRSYSDKNV